jgi:hypothetical protein
MRQSNRNVVRHQKSVFYHVDHNANVDIFKQARDLYTRMFIEDASLGVMPIGGRSRRKDFKVELAPAPTSSVRDLIVYGLAANLYSYREDLASTVCEFVQRSAALICASDRATYEIVYLEEPDPKRIIGFELVSIPEEQLLRRRGGTFQIVSSDIAAEHGTDTKIQFDDGDLVTIEAPVEFRKGLHNMRSGLLRLGQFPLTGLVLEASQNKIPYDFKAHERAMKLAFVEVVRPVGWNGRGTFNDCVLSYYWIQREILFERFKIEMREAILAGMNEVLRRVGAKLGFEAQLQVAGLPTVKDTKEARTKLLSGEMAFTDVMDVFRLV